MDPRLVGGAAAGGRRYQEPHEHRQRRMVQQSRRTYLKSGLSKDFAGDAAGAGQGRGFFAADRQGDQQLVQQKYLRDDRQARGGAFSGTADDPAQRGCLRGSVERAVQKESGQKRIFYRSKRQENENRPHVFKGSSLLSGRHGDRFHQAIRFRLSIRRDPAEQGRFGGRVYEKAGRRALRGVCQFRTGCRRARGPACIQIRVQDGRAGADLPEDGD